MKNNKQYHDTKLQILCELEIIRESILFYNQEIINKVTEQHAKKMLSLAGKNLKKLNGNLKLLIK